MQQDTIRSAGPTVRYSNKLNLWREDFVDDSRIYPEQRLWVQVLLTLIEDYRLEARKASGRSAPVSVKWRLERLRREVDSPYIREMCEDVNFNADHLIRKFDEIDAESGVADCTWTEFEQTKSVLPKGKPKRGTSLYFSR